MPKGSIPDAVAFPLDPVAHRFVGIAGYPPCQHIQPLDLRPIVLSKRALAA